LNQDHVEYFLDLVEPHIKGLEEVYDRLPESRQEIVRAFRKLRPKSKTNSPAIVTTLIPQSAGKPAEAKRSTKSVKAQPAEVKLESGIQPEKTQPVSQPINIESLEKDSEAVLASMGI
jgi:hypothetical protein